MQREAFFSYSTSGREFGAGEEAPAVLIAVGVQGGLLSVCQRVGLTDGMPAPLTTAKRNPQLLLVRGGKDENAGGVKNTEWDHVNTARPRLFMTLYARTPLKRKGSSALS